MAKVKFHVHQMLSASETLVDISLLHVIDCSNMASQPSDLRTLLHSLVNPASNEAYVRDQATLSNLFKQPEFFIALQAIASDRSIPQQERLLASVITGRELKTKWRSKLLVPENRKPEVRERLFSFLEEADAGVGAWP